MKKINKYFILSFILLFVPITVFAKTLVNQELLFYSIISEIISTIIITFFAFRPLYNFIYDDDTKTSIKYLFLLRILIIVVLNFASSVICAIADLIFTLLLSIVVSITNCREKLKIKKYLKKNIFNNPLAKNVLDSISKYEDIKIDKFLDINIECPKCGKNLTIKDNFCTSCSMAQYSFKVGYNNSNEAFINYFINRELENNNISNKMILSEMKVYKNILYVVFSVLLFIYVSSIFFHLPILFYLIGLCFLVVFYIKICRYNLINYLKKVFRMRSSECFSDLILEIKNKLVEDKSYIYKFSGVVCAFTLSFIIFSSPHIIYEKVSGGYAIKNYTFSVFSFDKVTIPKTYRGRKVIKISKNSFSNMYFLKEVNIPNNVLSIDKYAFKNCLSLKDIHLSNKIKYIGEGVFYNNISLKTVSLPSSLTFLGSGAFHNARNLVSIELSPNLSVISDRTFEYCKSLEFISIPDKVSVIGKYAFYRTKNLSEVNFSDNSELTYISDYSFSDSIEFYNVSFPEGMDVNPYAFQDTYPFLNY